MLDDIDIGNASDLLEDETAPSQQVCEVNLKIDFIKIHKKNIKNVKFQPEVVEKPFKRNKLTKSFPLHFGRKKKHLDLGEF